MISAIKKFFTKKEDLHLVMKLNELNNIENINLGGCAIVAYSLKKYLKKDNVKILYLMSKYDVYMGNSEKLNNGIAESCAHSIIEKDGKYIDSTGIYSRKSFLKRWKGVQEIIEVPMDLVLESINNSVWNSTFSRENNLYKIDRLFNLNGELLKEIK